METNNLVDAFRYFHPDIKRYTWRRWNPIKQAHLDYFIIHVSENLTHLIQSCKIRPSYRSDHSAIELEIILDKFEKGKGIWRLNCSLLKDSEYLEKINNLIDEVKKEYAIPVYNLQNFYNLDDTELQFTVSNNTFLEMLFLRIRGETIKYASAKKHRENVEEKNQKIH